MKSPKITGTGHTLSRAVFARVGYRHTFPFMTSLLMAAVITVWPRMRETSFHQGTSIWTLAMLVAVPTVFSLLCGGRFRVSFVMLAVVPPFIIVLPAWLQSAIRHPDYPVTGFIQYFLYCVAAPIFVVWIVTKLLKIRKASPAR